MAIVSDTVLIKVQMDTADAVRETQKLAAAQEKHAKQAAKAMDDFQRDATAALGKVEKSYQAQAKAAQEAAKAAAAAPGFLDRAAGAMGTFNKVVGFANQTLGAWKTALDLGGVAVDLLGKGLSKLGQAFGSSPDLRMMWEPDPMRGWIDGMKEAEKEADKWAAKIQAVYFGADVDSDASRARRDRARAEVERKRKEDEGWVDYMREKQLEAQKAREQDRKDRFNHEGKYARKARTGGGFDISSLGGDFGGSVDMEGKWAMSTSGLLNQAQTLLAMGDQLTRNLSDITTGVLDTFDPGSGRLAQSANRTDFGLGSFQVDDRKKPTVLEKMFGTPEDFNLYGDAWSTLTDSVTTAYEMMVTGAEDIGKTVKVLVGNQIMAEWSKMLVHSLEEAAFAVAALATGNFAGAATHGKAALMFGAGAAAAGVLASQLGAGTNLNAGGGGAGAGSGIGASASGVGLGVGGNDRPINRTFILGDSLGWETPRSQAARVRRSIDDMEKMARNSAGVEFR